MKRLAQKPELLLPAGNAESFYAAIDAGADAVYLGLKQFNARNRAGNFSPYEAAAIAQLAKSKGVKIYITLNTVIRNFDLPKLFDLLYQLSQIKPAALIIQDLGVQCLVQRFFPELPIHASTQMAVHNSTGIEYAQQSGFERVVIARELTDGEVAQLVQKSKIEIEMFVHGALCYSFSGMCLFSSFLGGASANRGTCAQPCRRIYSQNKKRFYPFSLKDNQLLGFVPRLSQMGISSLKIEGRMKPADYVSRVGKAYRMAIDSPQNIAKAESILENDMAREKTSYFFGKDVKNAVTQAATAGLLLGKVIRVEPNKVTFSSTIGIEPGSRLRFRNQHNDVQTDFKAEQVLQNEDIVELNGDFAGIKQGYEVYLTGTRLKFPSKINTNNIKVQERIPRQKAANMQSAIKGSTASTKKMLFLRVDNLDWLPLVDFSKIEGLLLQLSTSAWSTFPFDHPILKQHKNKILPELPRFISEGNLLFYKELCQNLFKAGYRNFFVSHLSQKLLLPRGAGFSTNEQVYLFNDAAISAVKKEKTVEYIYPLENDIANMGKSTDRQGIVPLYFYPQLFYSRMPINDLEKAKKFSDSTGESFQKHIRDGMTIVLPENPVSLFHYREKIERYGFNKYLIDVCFMVPNGNKLKEIIKAFQKSEHIKPSSLFNFKRELK